MRKCVSIISMVVGLAALAAGPAMAERRLALVIGNDRYDNLSSLQKAANDASAMETALTGLGFTVSRATNASRRSMNERIESFAGQVQRGDTALFFFAGHGVEIKGINYLLPTDTPDARDGQEGLISREGIAADSIIERLQERGARVTMLVLDACRDNPFKKPGTRGVGGTRGLGQMTPAEGVFVLFSAGLGQTALDRLSDNDPHPNSVFTRTFVNLLGRPGMSVLDIAKATQTEVRKLALTVDHRQQPAFYDQIDGIYVLAQPGTAVAATPTVTAPATAVPPRPAPPAVAALPPAVAPAPSSAATGGTAAAVFTSRTASVGSGPPNVQAGGYPTKPVTIIVPFASGGGADLVTRLVAPPMSAALGQPVVIENAPGGGGTIGMTKARNAAPDGYTLVIGGSASLIPSLMLEEKSYDPIADFSGIGLISGTSVVIAAKKDLPVNDLGGLITYVRSRGGSATYASGNFGTLSHLACQQFNSASNTRSTHTAFSGLGPAIGELAKGNVDYMCAEASAILPQARSGAVKPLAVTSAERLGMLPNVPTSAEAGLPGFLASSWYALFVRKGTSKGAIDRLSYALGRALDDPRVREKLMEFSGEMPATAHRSPQALDTFLRADIAKWTPVAKAARAN